MKNLKFMSVVLMLAVSLGVTAQSVRTEKMKEAKKELKEKASKEARKAAKKFKKDGWEVTPGQLPLERQLDRSYMLELQVDDDLKPLFVMGEAMSIGETYDAAKIQATELARVQIAGRISSETKGIVENLLANKQLAAGEAASINTTMMESISIFSAKLGSLTPVMECYRTLENKNKEVMVRLATKSSAIQEIAKTAIREELEKRGVEISKEMKEYLSTRK